MTAKSGYIYCNQALCISYKCICVNLAPLGWAALEIYCHPCPGILLPCSQNPLKIMQTLVGSCLHYRFFLIYSYWWSCRRKKLRVDSPGGKALCKWLKASTRSADGGEAFWKTCFSQIYLGRLLWVMQLQLYCAFQDILTICKTINVFQCFLRYLLQLFFSNPGNHTSFWQALHSFYDSNINLDTEHL